MRKFLASLAVVTCAAVCLAGQAAAQQYPGTATLTLSPSTVAPGGSVTATLSPCTLGETVSFTVAGTTHAATCAGTGGGAARGIMTPAGPTASVTFAAPTAPGTYVVTATYSGGVATATLTVAAPATGGGRGTAISTGADSDTPLWVAGTALVAGCALVGVAWRRRRPAAVG